MRTLTERVRPTRAFLVACVMVLVARLGLTAWSDDLDLFRGNTRDSSFLNIERNVVRARGAKPLILLAGSSRMRYGIPETFFAEASGLARTDVENIAVQAGTPLWMK